MHAQDYVLNSTKLTRKEFKTFQPTRENDQLKRCQQKRDFNKQLKNGKGWKCGSDSQGGGKDSYAATEENSEKK